MTSVLILLAAAVAVQAFRGWMEYLVTAGGTAQGWRRPKWFDIVRSDEVRDRAGLPRLPGWQFWRDDWHFAQALRNLTHTIGAVLACVAISHFLPSSVLAPISGSAEGEIGLRIALAFVASWATWLAGHGIGFSLVLRFYGRVR